MSKKEFLRKKSVKENSSHSDIPPTDSESSEKKQKSEKHRVEFRKNRSSRTRKNDWTQKYDQNQEQLEDEPERTERISGKGALVRKRTVSGFVLGEELQASAPSDMSDSIENLAKSQPSEIVSAPVDNAKRFENPFENSLTKGSQNSLFNFDSSSNSNFRSSPSSDSQSNIKTGLVLKVYGLNSLVEDSEGTVYSCITRRLLKTVSTDQRHVVVAGDRVIFRDALQPDGRKEGVIERVEIRRGTLSRGSWKRKHILVANVDQALIMVSAAEPTIKPNLIDRLLVTADRAGIRPIVCVNKIDLIDPAELTPLMGNYARMGYQTVCLSVKTGQGLDQIRRLLSNQESVVTGQSGVGKSSLLNAIDPTLSLRVGAVSQENQKGKHTTTTAELIRLSFGGYVVDTPGIRQFTLWDIVPEEVVGFYRDLRPFENQCRFDDCTHTHEDACAVKNAVADGFLDLRRYESYLSVRAGEMESIKNLE